MYDLNDYYEDERKWDEFRQKHKTCFSCRNYYEDYGMPCCKVHDDVLEDYMEERCEEWR